MFGLGGSELLVLGLLVLWPIVLVPLVFYLLMLYRVLAACAPENRRLEPALVWLQLIPAFGLVWQFVVVTAVSGSLHQEFQKRGGHEEPFPGQSVGLAMCVLSLCGFIPFLGVLAGLAAAVCWVLYWLRIAELKRKLVPVP